MTNAINAVKASIVLKVATTLTSASIFRPISF